MGVEATVLKVRTAHTGTYYPASGGGYNSYYGEPEDWEPGGLMDEKRHRVALVMSYCDRCDTGGEFESSWYYDAAVDVYQP